MIRQAHTYLVGALSGVTLIGVAIGVFVVLVSAQVFHDWPIAALGGSGQNAAVAPAKALPAATDAARTGGVGAASRTVHPHMTKVGSGAAAPASKPARHHVVAHAGPPADATGPATIVDTTPSSGTDESSSGGNSHSPASQPSSPSPSQSSSPSSDNPGGSGDSGSAATGSAGSTGSSGSGIGTTTAPVTTATTKPARVITEAVDETVKGVDEKALGGTLEKTGVAEVTEDVANGVSGSESVVGKTVEGAGEAVGGLLGSGGH